MKDSFGIIFRISKFDQKSSYKLIGIRRSSRRQENCSNPSCGLGKSTFCTAGCSPSLFLYLFMQPPAVPHPPACLYCPVRIKLSLGQFYESIMGRITYVNIPFREQLQPTMELCVCNISFMSGFRNFMGIFRSCAASSTTSSFCCMIRPPRSVLLLCSWPWPEFYYSVTKHTLTLRRRGRWGRRGRTLSEYYIPGVVPPRER